MMTIDNYYWMFSSAAQAISAVIAFVLAGVTLAFAMLDRVSDQDPTLYDVIEAFKVTLHREMAALVIVTVLAIALSLSATFTNPHPGSLRDGIMILATTMDLAALAGAAYFVIRIVSPRRYVMAAQTAYAAAIAGAPPPATPPQPTSAFFHQFIALEQDIRDYLRSAELYIPSQGEQRMTFSFRQMVNALYQNERISPSLRDSLLEINKFRNLLFHGHIAEVGEDVSQKLTSVHEQWKKEKTSRTTPPTVQ